MRIRKNKKLTASIIWSTAASSSSPNPPEELLQAHVCVVNRSPWDSPPSPPPLYPLDYPNHQAIETDNDSYGLNCDDFFPADNSTDSMKISSKSTEPATMEVYHPPPKRKPGRPRKVPVDQTATPVVQRNNTTPSNPEFYYYSGFGPRWGKRRGGREDGDDQKQTNNTTTVNDQKKKKNNNNTSSGRSCSSSSCSPCLIEETDDELDILDDDYDDESDCGRKRMRKPVKARSLKSLIM